MTSPKNPTAADQAQAVPRAPTSFIDKKRRVWSLDLDVYLVEQIHKRTDLRIDTLLKNDLGGLTEVFGDRVRFGQFLWVMCEEQAVAQTITPEDFARGFNGPTFEAAADALLAALADFIPSHQGQILRALMARDKVVTAEKVTELVAQIAVWTPETPSPPVTSSPASPGSIPRAGDSSSAPSG